MCHVAEEAGVGVRNCSVNMGLFQQCFKVSVSTANGDSGVGLEEWFSLYELVSVGFG